MIAPGYLKNMITNSPNERVNIGLAGISGPRLVPSIFKYGLRGMISGRGIALLSLMYDTGARVQEVIDLTSSTIHLDKPCTIQITGKGNKTRIVPLLEEQVRILRNYLAEFGLFKPQTRSFPLFSNSRHEKLTRPGVTHILLKYADKARKEDPKLIPDKLSCHSLRHSKAMHLL